MYTVLDCIGDMQFIEKNKCYNVTVPVTMFKYLPFNAGKTAHYRRHYELVSKFSVGLKTLLHQGLSEPEFYGDNI